MLSKASNSKNSNNKSKTNYLDLAERKNSCKKIQKFTAHLASLLSETDLDLEEINRITKFIR